MLEKDHFTFIDLFAGIGGFRLALEKSHGTCVFSSEINPSAQKTYQANFSGEIAGDITKITAQEIPPHDILCAGFPCQSFSISGKRQGFKDIKGLLFFEIIRIAKFHQPKILLLENVAALISHDQGQTLKTILEELDNINYDTFYQVLDTSNYGLPQVRKRVYLVAFRKDLQIKQFNFPAPYPNKTPLAKFLSKDNDQYAIKADLQFNSVPSHKKVSNNRLSIKRLGIVNNGGQGNRVYSPQGLAITLSASSGGLGSKTGLYYINNTIRKLSPKECLAIQGFPSNFKSPLSDQQAWKQIGNSVSPVIIDKIFQQILTLNRK